MANPTVSGIPASVSSATTVTWSVTGGNPNAKFWLSVSHNGVALQNDVELTLNSAGRASGNVSVNDRGTYTIYFNFGGGIKTSKIVTYPWSPTLAPLPATVSASQTVNAVISGAKPNSTVYGTVTHNGVKLVNRAPGTIGSNGSLTIPWIVGTTPGYYSEYITFHDNQVRSSTTILPYTPVISGLSAGTKVVNPGTAVPFSVSGGMPNSKMWITKYHNGVMEGTKQEVTLNSAGAYSGTYTIGSGKGGYSIYLNFAYGKKFSYLFWVPYTPTLSGIPGTNIRHNQNLPISISGGAPNGKFWLTEWFGGVKQWTHELRFNSSGSYSGTVSIPAMSGGIKSWKGFVLHCNWGYGKTVQFNRHVTIYFQN